ncbi:MAG: CotH kinase family protein [Chloroflexi bacterium]|nr:CotH kinase family protein [Chloroflexota bacterium]
MLVKTAAAALLALAVLAVPAAAQDVERPEGWDDYSHSNDTDPDYAVVFPQDAVNTITITIDPDTWQAMLDDMTGLYGEFGARQQVGGPRIDRAQPGEPPGGQPPADNVQRPQDPGGGFGVRGMSFADENPIWVAVNLEYNGQTWTNVGMRFKGNSSLASTWGSGIYKLPFKLDFDEFEDDYPEIDNQRFYGFKQLSFSSNWSDDSLLREKVTADVFREAGVPAAQTAFYAVYIDYGEGPVYFGLYTAVEVIEDTVIDTQFEDNDGNVYKPEGTGATFAAGTFDEDSFDKETNEEEADYSDILALYDALHADTRQSDPAAWRAGLEAVFDVDGFLLWMAANTVAQNWDTYGQMSHNYYLYNDPATGLLTWIPWDNNMALGDGMGGGRGGFPGNQGGEGRVLRAAGPGLVTADGAASFEKTGVTEQWPLIRFLMDDPMYHNTYVEYVDQVSTGAFEPVKMQATYEALHALIAPYVVGENGERAGYSNLSSSDAFSAALDQLIQHAQTRFTLAQEYVAAERTAD